LPIPSGFNKVEFGFEQTEEPPPAALVFGLHGIAPSSPPASHRAVVNQIRRQFAPGFFSPPVPLGYAACKQDQGTDYHREYHENDPQ
jgi:hypothetical protein